MNSIKRIKIPNELTKLARALPVDLYVVGGYVRNQLLGIDKGDIDLCSSISVDKIANYATECDFSVKYKNKTLGTAKLVYQDKVYDYAAFRKEEYDDSKSHKPSEINFVDDIAVDAKRRDFTINAIYYNINKQTLSDYYNGLIDLRKGVLRAVETPTFVMQNDGERVLRMIRLAGELNFKVEKNTLQAAQKNLTNLQGISADRRCEELLKIIYCDKKYTSRSKKKNFLAGLKILNRMEVWKYLGVDCDKVNYNMIKKVENRGLGLLIDLIDTTKPASVSYYIYKILRETSIPKKKRDQIVNIISGYYDALNRKSNKQYFFKYFDNFEDIFELLQFKSKNIAQKYQFFYKYIISYHLVVKVSDLNISAKDLRVRQPSLPEKQYEDVLKEILSEVFDGKIENNRTELLKELDSKFMLKKED